MRKVSPFLVPPLMATLVWVAFCAYLYFEARFGAVRHIGGRVDNAPYRASYIGLFLTPVVFIGFAALNGFCLALRSLFQCRVLWVYLGLFLVMSVAQSFLLYAPSIGDRFIMILAISTTASAACVVPMAAGFWLARKCAQSHPTPN